MALYGHAVWQVKHPTHVENTGGAKRFTTAISGSRVNSLAENNPSTLLAAADAWPTESGISFGAWHAPARNMPAVFVSTGRSFGWASEKK